MKVLRVHVAKALKIGKGEPKVGLDCARDGVAVTVRGDWVIITETQGTRAVMLHGSQVDRLDIDHAEALKP